MHAVNPLEMESGDPRSVRGASNSTQFTMVGLAAITFLCLVLQWNSSGVTKQVQLDNEFLKNEVDHLKHLVGSLDERLVASEEQAAKVAGMNLRLNITNDLASEAQAKAAAAHHLAQQAQAKAAAAHHLAQQALDATSGAGFVTPRASRTSSGDATSVPAEAAPAHIPAPAQPKQPAQQAPAEAPEEEVEPEQPLQPAAPPAPPPPPQATAAAGEEEETESVVDDKQEEVDPYPPCAEGGACCDDRAAIWGKGAGYQQGSFPESCRACGLKSFKLGFGGLSWLPDEYTKCLRETVTIDTKKLSQKCATCFSDQGEYGMQNCKMKCAGNYWCSKGCLDCNAVRQSALDKCVGFTPPLIEDPC